MSVDVEQRGAITIVTINRPEVRNCIDTPHAKALAAAFVAFDQDPDQSVAILHGIGGNFCAGADLKAVAAGQMEAYPPGEGIAPLGPTRMMLSKPVVAAIDGYCVAGGVELAIWADLRVMDPDATFGIFERRWGVPLIDGGTIRLPRLIGHSRALDLILTGRPVKADEALQIGLANRVSEPGKSLDLALELATQLASFPQTCMREDRMSVYEQHALSAGDAFVNEWRHGIQSLMSDTFAGATEFSGGAGRHGSVREVGQDISG